MFAELQTFLDFVGLFFATFLGSGVGGSQAPLGRRGFSGFRGFGLCRWSGRSQGQDQDLSGLNNAKSKRYIFWTHGTWREGLAGSLKISRNTRNACLNTGDLPHKGLNCNLSFGRRQRAPENATHPKTQILGTVGYLRFWVCCVFGCSLFSCGSLGPTPWNTCFDEAQTMKLTLWAETLEFWRLKVPNSRFALHGSATPQFRVLCAVLASNARFMRLFHALLDTWFHSPSWPASQFTACTSQLMLSSCF